jgi:hypothetical protein
MPSALGLVAGPFLASFSFHIGVAVGANILGFVLCSRYRESAGGYFVYGKLAKSEVLSGPSLSLHGSSACNLSTSPLTSNA